MSVKLKACVVGGGLGGGLSMTALRASERFELVGVADLNPEAREKRAREFGIPAFASHREMFEKCPADVVCVSTYAPSHEEIVRDALDALPLKGILVEKPLGHTAASGRRIVEAVRGAGLPMAVPHGLLTLKTTREIFDRAQSGQIGALKLIEIQNRGWDIINAGIHWLNFVVNLTELEPVDYVMALCESSARTFRDGMQVETTAVTYVQMKSGLRIVMNTGDDVLVNREGKGTLFRLVGTDGFIESWGWERAYRIVSSEFPKGAFFQPEDGGPIGHQWHLERMAGMADGGAPDYTIPESSLRALELCEAAYLSSRHGCKVVFPLEAFQPPAPSDWDPGQPYSGFGGGRDGRKLD